MRFHGWLVWLALATTGSAWATIKPVAFRLASLPASAEQGQKLLLCATNIGTGTVDVSLELINVETGGVLAQKTVTLAPLGSGTASQPCLTSTVDPAARAEPKPALVVGVAMVRKPLLSFREAQVTASIQVLSQDGNGAMHTVATIPLSRTAHPSDGAPVYAPPPGSAAHH